MIRKAIKKTNEMIRTLSVALTISIGWSVIACLPIYYGALLINYFNTGYIFWPLLLSFYPLTVLYVAFWMFSIDTIKRWSNDHD